MEASQINDRITFIEDLEIMEVDFSHMSFESSADVNQVYDRIEELVRATGKRWYFMVNYNNTRIQPDAWFQYALRGKNVNVEASLGTVRFDPAEPTRQEIEKRASSDDFNPNLVSTREEALDRIAEMREQAVA